MKASSEARHQISLVLEVVINLIWVLGSQPLGKECVLLVAELFKSHKPWFPNILQYSTLGHLILSQTTLVAGYCSIYLR